MQFKKYIQNEEKKDIQKTLKKIPKKHSLLVKDYTIHFEPNNALKGDKNHIGFIDEENKKIVISSPWNYGREYTLLHEVGHAVWKYIVSSDKKALWRKLLKEEKSKNNKDFSQNHEEIFCMCYAQYYAKNKLVKYNNEKLLKFISSL